MHEVLISIQPKWCELIASGKKTVEIRKTRPKINTPFKCYIYQTKMKWFFNLLRKMGLSDLANKLLIAKGKVIGEFVCDAIEHYTSNCTVFESVLLPSPSELEEMCLTLAEFNSYGTRGKLLYGWHISELKIYEQPKGLHHFFKPCGDCNKKGTRRCTEELTDCRAKVMTRPPQSWCYVELPKGGAE